MFRQGGSTYILTNKNLTTLYTGSTTDMNRKFKEHLGHYYPNAFSKRYCLYKLVFLANFSSIKEAKRYEYYIKGKKRNWKIDLIEKGNPLWRNLYSIINSDEIESYFSKYDNAVLG
ncbi:MAG: GIY-YIG nuclease family protein [Cytophagales bacterium]